MVDNQYVPAVCSFPGSCGTSDVVPVVNGCHPTISALVELAAGPHSAVATLYVKDLPHAYGTIAWTFVVR